jgi:hypothetical protein
MKTSRTLRIILGLVPALFFVVSLLAVASAPKPAYANSANISCGDPTKTGTVTVVVKITKENGSTVIVSWNAAISASDDANQKAAKIRAAAPVGDPNITIGGSLNVVSATTVNANDKITGMGFANDTTNELEATNTFSASVWGDGGIFSAAGVATGGGMVQVTYQGTTKTVPTVATMTGAQIEDALVAAFNASNIYCAISNTDPVPGTGTDGRYVYFLNPTSQMTVNVTDTGIECDLHMLQARASVPTLSTWGLVVLAVILAVTAVVLIQRKRRLAV